MTLQNFLKKMRYRFFITDNTGKSERAFEGVTSDLDKARIAYEFVRDEIHIHLILEQKI